jgi:ubiquinone/menaquinone biosynthesis C-methylase UbiE
MFDFEVDNLPDKILDCGAGPSSFCAEANERTKKVVAVDPIYEVSADELRQKISEVTPEIVQLLTKKDHLFSYDLYQSAHEVIDARHNAMDKFLQDYVNRDRTAYRAESIVDLPYEDQKFDVALSSHFLFLYDEKLSLKFHLDAIEEALRVAETMRIFPLTNLNADPSAHLKPVLESLSGKGIDYEIRSVNYEFQKGSNEMILLRG